MIASLPMYWRNETAAAWRGFWADVQATGLIELPDLTPPEALPEDWTVHWQNPNLLLSHTCSLPLRTALRDQVTYVGTFDFGPNAPDLPCPAGYYQSVYIAAPDAPDTPKRWAVNGFDSQSGWANLPQGTETVSYIETGSHAASLAAVAKGHADAAALDAITWRLLQRYDSKAQNVVTRGHSTATPGLPLITAKGRDPAPLRAALADACATSRWMGHPDLGGLRGFVVLNEADYLSLPVPKVPAQSAII